MPPSRLSMTPPMLTSTFWPTAPVVGQPRFISFPADARFVPQYEWGATPAAEKRKKELAKKRAAKLRGKAKKVENKAGIKAKPKAKGKITRLKPPGAHLSRTGNGTTVPDGGSQPEMQTDLTQPGSMDPSGLPAEPGLIDVPQNAAEGSANMKYIIGGAILLFAGLGAAYVVSQQRGKNKEDAVTDAATTTTTTSAPSVFDDAVEAAG